jgi:hypothetical protein
MLDEIMDTLLVADSISESSLYSVAFRRYKQLEGKVKKGKIDMPLDPTDTRP